MCIAVASCTAHYARSGVYDVNGTTGHHQVRTRKNYLITVKEWVSLFFFPTFRSMPRAAAHAYGGFQDSSLNVSPATKSSTGQQIRREIAFKKIGTKLTLGRASCCGYFISATAPRLITRTHTIEAHVRKLTVVLLSSRILPNSQPRWTPWVLWRRRETRPVLLWCKKCTSRNDRSIAFWPAHAVDGRAVLKRVIEPFVKLPPACTGWLPIKRNYLGEERAQRRDGSPESEQQLVHFSCVLACEGAKFWDCGWPRNSRTAKGRVQ